MINHITDQNFTESAERGVHYRNRKFGAWVLISLLVSALTLGVLVYIGWVNSKTHVDTRRSNVLDTYTVTTAHADSPGVNDWQNPEHNDVQDVITGNVSGTNTDPGSN
ncbi:MAG: hypothetical protein J6C44_08820 [Muribaculaceae bacterium]|nr:hypothetical protein [Muribaculaceae bacterium]